MRAMALVAHPDDCVIFAYSFIHNNPQYQWTVCYLTYNETHNRGKEFIDFWQRRNIMVKFLGFEDRWDHDNQCPGSIDPLMAKQKIQQVIANQDLVLTHNHNGEYGHPHHILVNQCANNHNNLVTFADPGTGTVKYSIEPGVYSLDELPQHRDIIAGFHKSLHTNEYTICKNI